MRRTALIACVAAFACLPPAAGANGGLQTAVFDPYLFGSADAGVAFDRVREAGASAVRLTLDWRDVAPAIRPEGFDAANPLEPSYEWAKFDEQVRLASARGLEVIATIHRAPAWAEGGFVTQFPGIVEPDPVELGAFAEAAARRYRARIRYWQVWNEPNLHNHLYPQFDGDRVVAPQRYRAMVNEVAARVRSVHPDNLIVAGGTAPFRDIGVTHTDWGPLGFMRELLCLNSNLQPKCHDRVDFDIWAHHPYTSGGPTHRANLPDDVSLGDLADMRRTLRAGIRAGNVGARQPVRFWVTEFSWDTSPPDPGGIPTPLHARWTAHALYRMWAHGIDLVTWFLLRDQPVSTSSYQSGLHFAGDRPKPALAAFRFPFVAFRQPRAVFVWGRTPSGRPGLVVVERRVAGGEWTGLGVLRADGNGIFHTRFQVGLTGFRTGWVRARTLDRDERSVPFSLIPKLDRFFNPFGTR